MSGETKRQWPDNITSGAIRYDPSGHFEGGFILRDADHGIPVFGSVNVQVFNYPGQTEDIAKALCDRWNSYASSQAEIERLRTALKPFARAGDIFEVRSSGRPNEDDDPVYEWEDHRVGARRLTVGDFRRARHALSGGQP